MLAVAATAVAACGALSAHATPAAPSLDASGSFDRRVVQPGQIAVALVTVTNRGPEVGGRAMVEITARGGTIVRTRATGSRCARPVGGRRVRCTMGVTAFGVVTGIVVHVRAGVADAVSLRSRLSSTSSPGSTKADEARIPISRNRADAATELSFVLEAPARAVVGRPFTARFRILNRGPGNVTISAIKLTTQPSARVRLSQLPRRLRAGAEHVVVARITPVRLGRLVLDLRVGSGGRARLGVDVRGASAST